MYVGTPAQTTGKPLFIEAESNEIFHDKHPLNEIFNCVKFWNNKGLECHINNNPNYSKGESYEDFVLRCIAADCRAFVYAKDSKFMNSPKEGEFITGKGGNHVWVNRSSDNERIMFIHF